MWHRHYTSVLAAYPHDHEVLGNRSLAYLHLKASNFCTARTRFARVVLPRAQAPTFTHMHAFMHAAHLQAHTQVRALAYVDALASWQASSLRQLQACANEHFDTR